MEPAHVAAALLSALLHASWNAAVKGAARPAEAMTGQMLIGAVLVLPGLLWTGLPAPASWIWIAASTAMNVVTVAALLRAYELAGFGVAYPVARAISVLLVVPLAAALVGDRLGASALGGVALIAAALVLLAFGSRTAPLSREALLWTSIAGVSTAAYVLCDAQGVRQAGSPWAYGFAVSVTNALAMGWRQRHLGSPLAALRSQWSVAIPTGLAAMASYLLILWVWSQAPIAAAAALRDTSAVFAILIAVVWLKEPITPVRVLAVLLAAAAVPLLRLG